MAEDLLEVAFDWVDADCLRPVKGVRGRPRSRLSPLLLAIVVKMPPIRVICPSK